MHFGACIHAFREALFPSSVGFDEAPCYIVFGGMYFRVCRRNTFGACIYVCCEPSNEHNARFPVFRRRRKHELTSVSWVDREYGGMHSERVYKCFARGTWRRSDDPSVPKAWKARANTHFVVALDVRFPDVHETRVYTFRTGFAWHATGTAPRNACIHAFR